MERCVEYQFLWGQALPNSVDEASSNPIVAVAHDDINIGGTVQKTNVMIRYRNCDYEINTFDSVNATKEEEITSV